MLGKALAMQQLGRMRLVYASSHAAGKDSHGKDAIAIVHDPDRDLPPEKQDKPGLISRIALRFKGIPLKGEGSPPSCALSDMDKFVAMPLFPEIPKDFKEHPDRDLKNYPYPLKPMYLSKARMQVLPDSWFQPFYKVTGTTGPYVFFFGLYTFLIGNSILIMDTVLRKYLFFFIPTYVIFSRIFGYRLQKWHSKNAYAIISTFENHKQEELDTVQAYRKESNAAFDSLNAMKEQFPTIIKENMALQLEASYRKNVSKVASEMKRRLDYLQETEATKRRFEREHQLKWISNAVRDQITSNKDGIKDRYMDECITKLKQLAVARSA